MVLTLSRQFVTLTGTGKAVRVFFYNLRTIFLIRVSMLNLLTSNDPYMGRTAPITSKRRILYIYSTNIGTEYFKHGLYFPFFFSLQNAIVS